MTPAEALVTILNANAAVAASVSSRVYPVMAPQVSALPRVVYSDTGTSREVSMAGASTLGATDFAVTAWAATYALAKSLGASIRTALHGYQGAQGDLSVRGVFVASESDTSEDALENEGARRYGATVNVSMHWRQ